MLKPRVSLWKLVSAPWGHSAEEWLSSGCSRWGWRGVGQVGFWSSPGLGNLFVSRLPLSPPPGRVWIKLWLDLSQGRFSLSLPLAMMAAALPAVLSAISQRRKSPFSILFSVEWGMSVLWPLQRAAKDGESGCPLGASVTRAQALPCRRGSESIVTRVYRGAEHLPNILDRQT